MKWILGVLAYIILACLPAAIMYYLVAVLKLVESLFVFFFLLVSVMLFFATGVYNDFSRKIYFGGRHRHIQETFFERWYVLGCPL